VGVERALGTYTSTMEMGIRFDEQYWRWAVDEKKKDPNPIPD